MRWLPALLIACSCAAEVSPADPPTLEQNAAVNATLASWQATIGEPGEACDPTALRFRPLPPDRVHAECLDSPAEPVTACLWARPITGEYSVVYANTRYVRVRERSITHELTHWLERCSGRWPRGDAEHADLEVWPGVQALATGEIARKQL